MSSEGLSCIVMHCPSAFLDATFNRFSLSCGNGHRKSDMRSIRLIF